MNQPHVELTSVRIQLDFPSETSIKLLVDGIQSYTRSQSTQGFTVAVSGVVWDTSKGNQSFVNEGSTIQSDVGGGRLSFT